MERDIADYIVFPQPLDGVTAPRLMASLKEKDGRLVIEDFPRDSVSQKAGLKAGDRIIALDGAPVATMEDVKLALFYKKKDDTVRVKVARKRFLLGGQGNGACREAVAAPPLRPSAPLPAVIRHVPDFYAIIRGRIQIFKPIFLVNHKFLWKISLDTSIAVFYTLSYKLSVMAEASVTKALLKSILESRSI